MSACLTLATILFEKCSTESSSVNAANHNLDLSLGNSNCKQSSAASGNDSYSSTNAATGQRPASIQFVADWRNRGLRPKVLFI